jgi:hypothetical protein
MALADGQGTRDPMVGSIVKAQRINQMLGGMAVYPWELGMLPDEWMDAFMMMAFSMPKMREGRKQVDDAFERFRKGHPEYGKTH